ncbi:8-amino-7-oxononanoate synthase [Novipirellula galeiformis]|uniref:8-amino-7-oxononanoate synthase n=1 Tax=Novipirellula galeiformis TaxID=2528004 RepID=A0A5C6CI28_9BACT|nr:8-amino-7-oxononanoate synthase [Novipirellula galeiformis]TWU23347.1 8-amino-7-oxononanoate synthase [Novipirellula galeiformis]
MFDYLADRLAELKSHHRLRTLVPRQPLGIEFIDDAQRRLINFGSNDYLGLATSRSPSPIAPSATGSTASALVCGWTPLHQQLAERIAQLESTESAILFPSGYAACSGTVATLAEEGDLILSDELNHASLIEGCRLSRAECIVYPHRDHEFVANTLAQRRHQFTRVWIVTDGVFSMDGHVAPLRELADLVQRFTATLIVDEAHGTGVLGKTGSGLCEALEVKDRVAIRIGTLSKAIGGQGGFVAGPKVVTDYLVNRCRSLIFSTSLAPSAVAASLASIESFQAEPSRRHRVQSIARHVRERLSLLTTCELENSVPIIPIVLGQDAKAMTAFEKLVEAGFYVPAIRPPTVPRGTSRLRLSLSALHDDAMIESLIRAVAELIPTC